MRHDGLLENGCSEVLGNVGKVGRAETVQCCSSHSRSSAHVTCCLVIAADEADVGVCWCLNADDRGQMLRRLVSALVGETSTY